MLNTQIRDIGSGNFGVAKLMKDITQPHGELVAIKFIPRGDKVCMVSYVVSCKCGLQTSCRCHAKPPTSCTTQIDKNVEREIINHRSLLHPNIIRFREVLSECGCGGFTRDTRTPPSTRQTRPGVFDTHTLGHCHGIRSWW